MGIDKFLEILEGERKRHVLLIVTPQGKYPINILGQDFYDLEKAVLSEPKSYISIYEEGTNEIMQFTAFRLFLSQIIADKYDLPYKTTDKVKRMDGKELEAFFVAKSFFDTVPFGVKTEKEAIESGKNTCADFLNKYPQSKFEYATVALRKDSNEANVILDLSIKNQSEDYYFDRVYIR
ncbi:hypothetical protein P5G60_06595 [Paenibacillus jamilae]|nr:hypothetical protein [Paenibacillus jamilae]